MRSRSSFVTLGLLAEKKTKKKTRTVTVWPKMELMESLVKTSVRPFDSSTCTLQTENTGKKEKAMDQKWSSPKTRARWRGFLFFFLWSAVLELFLTSSSHFFVGGDQSISDS